MPFDSNYQLWLSAKKDTKELIQRQNALKFLTPISNPLVSFRLLSQLYILYSKLVGKLSDLYKETGQIQKREVIRNLAEPAIGRLIQIREKLKDVELSEFVFLDKALIEQNMTPYDLLIWSSAFVYKRPPEIKSIIIENQFYTKKSKEEIGNAVNKIQAHERARRARLFKVALDYGTVTLDRNMGIKVPYSFYHKKDTFLLFPIKKTIFPSDFLKPNANCQRVMGAEVLEDIATDDDELIEEQTNAALIIQAAWRHYQSEKRAKMKFIKKQMLYGIRKSKRLFNPDEYERDAAFVVRRDQKGMQLEKDYDQLMDNERLRLLEEHKPQIMEDISDHIRAWFREFYDAVNDFHPYPEALKSGTVLLLTDETMTLQEFRDQQAYMALSKEAKNALKEKEKQAQLKLKEQRKRAKQKELLDAKKMLASGVYDIAKDFATNSHVEHFEKTFEQYSNDWKNIDEFLNREQAAIKEWVTEGQLAEIHKELRLLVDEYMRVEYDHLKEAWCADNKKPFKSILKDSKASDKKKKKKKGHKDMTEDRTLESLYEELRADDVINIYPVKAFRDYLGDFNFLADDIRNEDKLTILSGCKADIKIIIQDMLYGMGIFDVDKPKALCVVGPPNTGKKLLCNIIAAEIGALFINLSPEKTFPFSKNLKYFLHVVMKVAKAFQPTILFIDEAHRVYWKKVPKEDADLQPTLLKTALVKTVLKSIGKKDKIMLLGTSSAPWTAAAKFKKTFQNILLTPDSDYGSMFLMWLEMLTQNIDSNHFEDALISALAKVLQKYKTGDIVANMAKSLGIERRLRLHSNPLQPNEFLDYFLLPETPVFPPEEKDLEKYKAWCKKSNKFSTLRALKEAKKNKNKKK